MKQIYILAIIFLFSGFNTNAQTTDVVSDVMAWDLEIKGKDLYFSNYYRKRVSKININRNSSTVIDVTNRIYPFGLAIKGKDLYISKDSGIPKMIKIDISDSNYVVTDIPVITNSNYVPLAIHGNELYYFAEGKIFKFNVNDDTPIITEVVTNLSNILSMVIHGNELYFSDSVDKISKINLTHDRPIIIDVVTNLNFVSGIAIKGNELYFSDWLGNKISKFNIDDTMPIITDVVAELNGPFAIEIHGNDLYISELGALKISKFSLVPPLRNINTSTEKITLFPNPSSDVLQVDGLDKSVNYEIYSSIGQKVKKGIISNNENIDIQNLTTGLYFLKFENGNTIKFIKE